MINTLQKILLRSYKSLRAYQGVPY